MIVGRRRAGIHGRLGRQHRRTILVGGLNAGGRGFFALDITNPIAPRALWEFGNDRRLCSVTAPDFADPDIGFSFGNPILTKRAADQRWVVLVTSGYNVNPPGHAHRGQQHARRDRLLGRR